MLCVLCVYFANTLSRWNYDLEPHSMPSSARVFACHRRLKSSSTQQIVVPRVWLSRVVRLKSRTHALHLHCFVLIVSTCSVCATFVCISHIYLRILYRFPLLPRKYSGKQWRCHDAGSHIISVRLCVYRHRYGKFVGILPRFEDTEQYQHIITSEAKRTRVRPSRKTNRPRFLVGIMFVLRLHNIAQKINRVSYEYKNGPLYRCHTKTIRNTKTIWICTRALTTNWSQSPARNFAVQRFEECQLPFMVVA